MKIGKSPCLKGQIKYFIDWDSSEAREADRCVLDRDPTWRKPHFNALFSITHFASRYSIESARLAAQQQLNKQASKEQINALAEQILAQKKLEEQIRKQQKAESERSKINQDFEGVKRSVIKTEDESSSKRQADH